MTVQMTLRIEDALAAFIDQAVESGEGSRADIVNRAIKRELRRRSAEHDARIYAAGGCSELESDAYTQWSAANATHVLSADL